MTTISDNRLLVVERFMRNVYGKRADVTGSNANHDGSEGHWLERQMGIQANRDNSPDLFGFEMKNDTSSKTTFGDWSASYYLYNNQKAGISRDEFIEIFGKPNPKKNNRPSWSGTPIPTINRPSTYNGSRMEVNVFGDIHIIYDYNLDPRENKERIIPENLKVDNLTLACWTANSLREKLLRKFGVNGWFKCYKNDMGVYSRIAFGNPITFESWINHVKDGSVFFDSGMYMGNSRNYSQWRANNSYWEQLITITYPEL